MPRLARAFFCTILLFLSICCLGPNATPVTPTTTPEPTVPITVPPTPHAFQKGMNYTAWFTGQLSTLESDRSLANLAATGANWVAIAPFGYQTTYTSTHVFRDPRRTPSDDDLAHAIATAHSLGLNVMLKPHVDLRHDPGHWRGNIGEAFTTEAQWQAWFASYRTFIEHYAALAQAHGVEQFCIGTELVGTSEREADWRAVIAGVRERFDGPITYAGNHGTEDVHITWWDGVDYIGIDAYYVLTEKLDPTVKELKAAWIDRGYLATIAGLAEQYDKPVLITEIGYRSGDGTIKTPWDWEEQAFDPQEQADAYRAALETLWGQPWLAGIYWWNWEVNPQQGGEEDTSYTPYGKLAGEILRTYYGGSPRIEIAPTPPPAAAADTLALPAPIPALVPHPGWTSHTATGHVNDLAFDRNGNLWLATPGGLLRWAVAGDLDAGAVTKYTTEHGLAHNWVETIEIAPDGDLWIGTGGGISHFDGQTWTTYDDESGLPCNGVTDIAFAQNGLMWVGTFGCGVVLFNGHTWATLTEEHGLLESHVLCVTPAPDGPVLFGTWAGVSYFDGRKWGQYSRKDGLVHHGVEAIAIAPDGALWFGTWEGISRLNNTIWTEYDPGADPGWVESIVVAPGGAATAGTWAGTREGIFRFDEDRWTWDAMLAIDGQPDERGVSLAVGPAGDLWVGTYNSGLYRFDGETWTNYTLHGSLPSNKVTGIATGPDGAVWVRTKPDRYEVGGGTWQFDGQGWTAARGDDSWPDSDRLFTLTAPDGTVWLVGERNVARFDGTRWIAYTAENGLIDDRVTGIALDADGTIWIATKGGLSRYTPSP